MIAVGGARPSTPATCQATQPIVSGHPSGGQASHQCVLQNTFAESVLGRRLTADRTIAGHEFRPLKGPSKARNQGGIVASLLADSWPISPGRCCRPRAGLGELLCTGLPWAKGPKVPRKHAGHDSSRTVLVHTGLASLASTEEELDENAPEDLPKPYLQADGLVGEAAVQVGSSVAKIAIETAVEYMQGPQGLGASSGEAAAGAYPSEPVPYDGKGCKTLAEAKLEAGGVPSSPGLVLEGQPLNREEAPVPAASTDDFTGESAVGGDTECQPAAAAHSFAKAASKPASAEAGSLAPELHESPKATTSRVEPTTGEGSAVAPGPIWEGGQVAQVASRGAQAEPGADSAQPREDVEELIFETEGLELRSVALAVGTRMGAHFLAPLGKRRTLPLLLYLPGLDATGVFLDCQLASLREHYDVRCMAVPPRERGSYLDLASRAAALIGHERAARRGGDSPASPAVTIVAESFGAGIGVELAARNPDLVDYLLLVNSASGVRRQPALHYGSLLVPHAPEIPFLQRLTSFAVAPVLASWRRLSERNQRLIVPPFSLEVLSQEVVGRRLQMMAQWQPSDNLLQRITARTLLVASGADRLLPSVEEAHGLATCIPHCQIRILPFSGHVALLEEDVSLRGLLQEASMLLPLPSPSPPSPAEPSPSLAQDAPPGRAERGAPPQASLEDAALDAGEAICRSPDAGSASPSLSNKDPPLLPCVSGPPGGEAAQPDPSRGAEQDLLRSAPETEGARRAALWTNGTAEEEPGQPTGEEGAGEAEASLAQEGLTWRPREQPLQAEAAAEALVQKWARHRVTTGREGARGSLDGLLAVLRERGDGAWAHWMFPFSVPAPQEAARPARRGGESQNGGANGASEGPRKTETGPSVEPEESVATAGGRTEVPPGAFSEAGGETREGSVNGGPISQQGLRSESGMEKLPAGGEAAEGCPQSDRHPPSRLSSERRMQLSGSDGVNPTAQEKRRRSPARDPTLSSALGPSNGANQELPGVTAPADQTSGREPMLRIGDASVDGTRTEATAGRAASATTAESPAETGRALPAGASGAPRQAGPPPAEGPRARGAGAGGGREGAGAAEEERGGSREEKRRVVAEVGGAQRRMLEDLPQYRLWNWLTRPDFTGLENIPHPEAGPLLFVGNHTLFGVYDMPLMLYELQKRRGLTLRGLADPLHWSTPLGEIFAKYGAVKASPRNCFRLLADGEAVLLYPGGGREVAKRKGEKYRLLWKEDTDFVRLAIRFGATIVPFSAIGVEDAFDILMDPEEIMASPVGDILRPAMEATGLTQVQIPLATGGGLLPRPERLYFHFGTPVRTDHLGRSALSDRDQCHQLYLEVRHAVEGGISMLQERRAGDPLQELLPRTLLNLFEGWDGL